VTDVTGFFLNSLTEFFELVNSSYHTKGLAVDITADNIELENLLIKAKMVGFKGIGIYTLKNFLHPIFRRSAKIVG